MNVTLTPELEKKVRELVATGRYGDGDELLAYASSLIPEPVGERARLLDEMTLQAMEEVRQGKSRELTPDVWEEIISESDRIVAEGTPIPWYITGEEG